MSNNKNSQWLMRMLVAATVNNSVRNRQTFSLYDVYFYLKRFILDTLAFFPNLVLRLIGNEWPPNATFFRKNGIYFILVLLSPLLAETVYKVATKKKRGQTSRHKVGAADGRAVPGTVQCADIANRIIFYLFISSSEFFDLVA